MLNYLKSVGVPVISISALREEGCLNIEQLKNAKRKKAQQFSKIAKSVKRSCLKKILEQ